MYKKVLALLLVVCFVLCSISSVSAVEDNLATNGNGTGNTVSAEKLTTSAIVVGLNLVKNVSSSKKVLKKYGSVVEIHIPIRSVSRKVHRAQKLHLSPAITVSF